MVEAPSQHNRIDLNDLKGTVNLTIMTAGPLTRASITLARKLLAELEKQVAR